MFTHRRNMITKLVPVLLFILIHLSNAYPSIQDDEVHSEKQRYTFCGRNLARAVELICYASSDLAKRSVDSSLLTLHSTVSLNGRAKQFIRRCEQRKLIRTRRGIADDCCLQPCTYETLTQYCSNTDE